ncbi:ATP-dependent DNA helicase [Brumicola nitratireducens]|uniref:ATP-dependent DNA helicase YoaA n=1 Tax=Glaciecola nitratireducens (strain JCM 12485 / KCTC 12276 / FR1064) TaxID=1085623 RepID=G4QKM8_GLANF|nr:ATP-dependent DNA helicase [Glaciecola nitratireducens]AEP30331.1 ATP-dependent helicase [Glaciecola nitratireducens FR1064]
MSEIESFFSNPGPLAEVIAGFTPRDAQTTMAKAVATAIKERGSLIVEAGTGTGKTFAYLAPALLSKKKFIVSTGTKNLQEQLFHRDLPMVKKAIDKTKKTALLKGRANYLCLHRLSQHGGGNVLLEKEVLNEFSLVRKWASTTSTGDIGELKTIKEDAKVLPIVTSTVDNCLGKDCPSYEDCYLVKARRKAMEADVIVVNHHLFFADLALKDTGFGELIPDVDVVIFDEAHQVPDIASEYFGENLSSRQVQDLTKDIIAITRSVLKDADQLAKIAEKCQMHMADLRLLFPHNPSRGNWAEKLAQTDIRNQIDIIKQSLDQLYEIASVQQGRDKDLDLMIERVFEFSQRLEHVTDVQRNGVSLWYETTPRQIILHLTPLSIADKFSAIMQAQNAAWIFTSATLMVDDNFDHYRNHMGLHDAKTLALDSPFDYQNQAMLCIPRFLPEPTDRAIKHNLVDIACRLIDASKGRAFILFTSHAMMREVAALVEEKIDNPILVQGSTTKQALLDEYLKNQDAVLFGTGAFWEGVDVKGNDLLCVMIDKLPFASPDDPLLQARIEDCKKQGGNAFAQIQIPQAVITLKQGAGRLIRDETDKGVLVICDNRLVTKQYGQTFIASLPNMKRTRSLDAVAAFLHKIE